MTLGCGGSEIAECWAENGPGRAALQDGSADPGSRSAGVTVSQQITGWKPRESLHRADGVTSGRALKLTFRYSRHSSIHIHGWKNQFIIYLFIWVAVISRGLTL